MFTSCFASVNNQLSTNNNHKVELLKKGLLLKCIFFYASAMINTSNCQQLASSIHTCGHTKLSAEISVATSVTSVNSVVTNVTSVNSMVTSEISVIRVVTTQNIRCHPLSTVTRGVNINSETCNLDSL